MFQFAEFIRSGGRRRRRSRMGRYHKFLKTELMHFTLKYIFKNTITPLEH
jgi:hypothetical protein